MGSGNSSPVKRAESVETEAHQDAFRSLLRSLGSGRIRCFFSSSSCWASTGYIGSANKTDPVNADVGDANAEGGAAAAEVKARIENVMPQTLLPQPKSMVPDDASVSSAE